jgi:hypothetical protein
VIERHFSKPMDPGLIGPRFLAAIVDGENFAPDLFGDGLIEKDLRARRHREQRRANRQGG